MDCAYFGQRKQGLTCSTGKLLRRWRTLPPVRFATGMLIAV